MGNISRILAVATAFLSMAFLGFALVATRLGGPNWNAAIQSLAPTLEDPAGYVFSRSVGENPQWTATSTSGDTVKTATVLPEVIVAAYDHKIAAVKAELDELTNEQPQLEQRRNGMAAAIAADEAALGQSVRQREQYLEQLRQQYTALSQQVVQKSEESQQIEQVVEARRMDVFRLDNQLENLDADDARILQIEQQMLDLIRQIDADLAKAQRRQAQLKSRLGEVPPPEPYSPQPASSNDSGN